MVKELKIPEETERKIHEAYRELSNCYHRIPHGTPNNPIYSKSKLGDLAQRAVALDREIRPYKDKGCHPLIEEAIGEINLSISLLERQLGKEEAKKLLKKHGEKQAKLRR